jgi:terephthalate 1,2-dioxygenase reductase component
MTHFIHIADTDVRFACEAREPVLDAALRAGIAIPHACRKGVCGNCAGRVVEGEFACGTSSPEVLTPGQTLLCQTHPRSDLKIAVARWQHQSPQTTQRLQARVYRNTRVAEDVYLLQLRLPAGQRAKFRAGQYLQIVLPDGARRSFSMANPPHESDGLQLHIRQVPGGRFSALLGTLATGDVLDIELPFGQVALDAQAGTPLLCVCGGTGFAPVKSLLDDLARNKSQRPITLIWGARDRAGLYLLEQVTKWQRSLPGLHFMAALESAAQAQSLGAFHGRVDDAVRSLPATPAFETVYCCGSPAMVGAVRKACMQALGIGSAQFHADVFVSGP